MLTLFSHTKRNLSVDIWEPLREGWACSLFDTPSLCLLLLSTHKCTESKRGHLMLWLPIIPLLSLLQMLSACWSPFPPVLPKASIQTSSFCLFSLFQDLVYFSPEIQQPFFLFLEPCSLTSAVLWSNHLCFGRRFPRMHGYINIKDRA